MSVLMKPCESVKFVLRGAPRVFSNPAAVYCNFYTFEFFLSIKQVGRVYRYVLVK